MSIEKIVVSEADASLYQGYPQMDDVVYLMDDRDNRQGIIADWCEENCYYAYFIFNHSVGKKGFWFSNVGEQERFEKEWM